MKKWFAILACMILLFGLASCTPAPEAQIPADAYDLAYDMNHYSHFANIFDEKAAHEWDAMGSYTILLEGLHVPVLVDMSGMNVLAVRAHGQTIELGTDGQLFQDCSPVSICSTEDAVIVNISWDYNGKTFLLTANQCYSFQPEGDISTQIFVQENGVLTYRRYWGEYVTSFEQWDTAPLDLCTSREQFLYETGRAEIKENEVILIAENTVIVLDQYDLDAMFAEAKAAGEYAQYDTVDDLLAANLAKASQIG